jgi:hypothetical protein
MGGFDEYVVDYHDMYQKGWILKSVRQSCWRDGGVEERAGWLLDLFLKIRGPLLGLV